MDAASSIQPPVVIFGRTYGLNRKHFPKKPHWQLTLDARFDGSMLKTDPVDHEASPGFDCELAWEVDRRGLHVLKIQKTPVKLQCFAYDKKTKQTESVGYVVLDLTLAQQPTMKPRWFPILNSKYPTKPQLLLTLGVENDEKQIDEQNKRMEAETKEELKENVQLNNLEPVMVDDGEYYQIGQVDECSDFFSFSVTIGFASNLDMLVPTTTILPTDNQGFFFFYSLFGNDIFTDFFSDLSSANFSAERATVQIRSNISALFAFLRKQSKIQIHLCCGDKSLGRANVSLTELIVSPREALHSPVVIEDAYEIKTSRQSQMDDVSEVQKSTVAVVLTLSKKEKIFDPVEPIDSAEVHTPPSVRRNLQYPQTPPQKLEKVLGPSDDSGGSENAKSDDKLLPLPVTPRSEEILRIPVDRPNSSSNGSLMTYSFSVDLRIIKNIMVDTPFNCFIRYSYSYFGDVAPMLTHPTVDARLGCSSILPHGYSTFRFMTTSKQLDDCFRKNPIKIEVLHRDLLNGRQKDIIIGVSMLHLGQLVDSDKSIIVDETGKTAWRRSVLLTLPVISKESRVKVAEIQLFTNLDDYGPAENNDVVNNNDVQSTNDRVDAESRISMVAQEAWEDRLSEQAALEIERWKKWQEAAFMKQLKERETEHMEAMASEWTQRETERELLVQKKLSEYQHLEDKLSTELANIEKRERQLIIDIAENQRIKNDLRIDYERNMQTLKDSSRRLKEECDHKIELERNKTRAVQEQCHKHQRRVIELEKNLEVRESEFRIYRDQKAKPEIRLESELNLMKIEHAELQRKVQMLTKSKVHYKQQHGRCLRELARLKQAMQSAAEAQLQKQQEELDEIRKNFITSEMNQRVNGDSNDALLDELKCEVQRTNSETVRSNEQIGQTSWKGAKHLNRNGTVRLMSKLEESELAHLQSERKTLLRTGCYKPDDHTIRQLDEKIDRMILRNER